MVDIVEDAHELSGPSAPPSYLIRLFRSTIHFFSYHLILKRQRTSVTRAAVIWFNLPPARVWVYRRG